MNTVRKSWLLALSLLGAISLANPVVAQQFPMFADLPTHALVSPSFTDQEIDKLLSTLDWLLAHETDPATWADDATTHLSNFMERVQAGRLTDEQQARVSAHLAEIERQHPQDAAVLETQRRVVTTLTIGKPAPDIVGKDFEGKEFHLSDYRGRVVVLAFSGEWCGACRLEYPYQRLLMDLYKDRPLTVLSVNSDKDLQFAKKSKMDRGLTYRSWWDGGGAKSTQGPIASAWGVTGWPTIYVIDERGIIRFVNLRQEDLLKGVKQLMNDVSASSAMTAAGLTSAAGPIAK
jgi:peroxiredoxin